MIKERVNQESMRTVAMIYEKQSWSTGKLTQEVYPCSSNEPVKSDAPKVAWQTYVEIFLIAQNYSACITPDANSLHLKPDFIDTLCVLVCESKCKISKSLSNKMICIIKDLHYK